MGAKGMVTHAIAQMRSAPSHRADLVCQALFGWPVVLLACQEAGWVKIQCFAGAEYPYEGWVEWEAVHWVPEDLWKSWLSAAGAYIVQRNFQLSYDQAQDKPESLPSFLPAGAIIYQWEAADSPWDVELAPLPFLAWEVYQLPRVVLRKIHGPETSPFLPDDGPANATDINSLTTWLEMTTPWVGSPYLWGGNSSWGLDCSGFVFLYYWLQGRIIPRDAWQQAKIGWPAKYQFQLTEVTGLQAGDLLFFGEVRDKITHVAVYLEKDLYLHASGCLRLGRLVRRMTPDDAYRYQTLQQIRRIKPERLPSVGSLF